ncbi:MAG: hypothetical protein IAE82_18870, partial [Opitutaceae bacterium]|nr:hypothetical protein [Opitutaceae bacterium]
MVRTPDVAGRVVLDVRKIVGSGEAAADRIVATDLAGNAVPLDAVAGSRVAVAARPEQWVIVRPASIAPQAMQKGVQWLPGICLAPGASPEAAKEVFSSYADFATVPVAWDTAIDAYRLEGAVGVARNGDLAQGGAIGRTATVKLQFNGVSDATPTEFAVEDAGLGGERSFSSVFRGTDVPKPMLVVRSTLGGEQPYVLEVQPRVELTPRRNPMLGLGLDEIVVTVECVEAHGALVALPGPSPVTLRSSSGREEGAERLALSAAEPRAEFRFRSTWLGPARVVATT